MIFCIFCNKKFNNKKAYMSHAESETHKENENNIKKDKRKYKELFLTNLSSFIYKYTEYKQLEDVYKIYMQNNIISCRDVGYKNIVDCVEDLKDKISIQIQDNKIYVKGYDRYIPEDKVTRNTTSAIIELEEESDAEEVSAESFDGDINMFYKTISKSDI